MQVSKQDNLAHVILATSDYAFLGWLEKGQPVYEGMKHFLPKADKA